jgi:hypothetical protein
MKVAAPVFDLDEEEPRPVKRKQVFRKQAAVDMPIPEPTPAPAQNSKFLEGAETIGWVVLAGEAAFVLYHLVLKNFI